MDYPQTAVVLFKEAKKMGLAPKWITDYGLFSIMVNKRIGYIFYARNFFNTNLSGNIAMDKHATRTILDLHKFPNVPFGMFSKKNDVKQFFQKHSKIIAKPVFGSGSKDVHLITSSEEIPELEFDKYIFEKFIEGREMRYLVFRDKVLAVHHKSYQGPINNPAKLKRISYSQESWNKELVNLTLEIADKLYLQFAAVDFLIDKRGKAFVLEVNSSPGLYFFEHPTAGPTIPIARIFLEATIAEIEKY